VNKVIKLASLVLAGAVIVGCSDKKAKEQEETAALPLRTATSQPTTMQGMEKKAGNMMENGKDKAADMMKGAGDKMKDMGDKMKPATTMPAGM
jgi:hypothetical protein